MASITNRLLVLGRRSYPLVVNVRAITCSVCMGSTDGTKVTHTGQAFDVNDYRNVRYVQRGKEVNEMIAAELIDDIPPKEINARSTHCDGGGGALGHPKVFINLDQSEPQACGYCGLRFVQAPHH